MDTGKRKEIFDGNQRIIPPKRKKNRFDWGGNAIEMRRKHLLFCKLT